MITEVHELRDLVREYVGDDSERKRLLAAIDDMEWSITQAVTTATLRPLSELAAADGDVLLWLVCVDAVQCYGVTHYTHGDSDQDWYWSPLPKVRKPDGAR